MRRPGQLLGILVVLGTGIFASCSGSEDDPLVPACRVIVETCHRGRSVGDCLDDLAPLAPDCLNCISTRGGCDYTVCQSTVAGCRLPADVLDPGDQMDFGPRPTDAGSTPGDSGSDG